VTPAFSPDGRWVYASRTIDGIRVRLQRFALVGATGLRGEAPGQQAAGRGAPLRPSLAYEAVDVFTNRSRSGRDDRAAQ
jgi:hypothetical protein